MNKIYLIRKFALLAALASLGLTACQKPAESPNKSGEPTNSAPSGKSEHPEHPK